VTLVVVRGGDAPDEVLEGDHLGLVEILVRRVDARVDHGRDEIVAGVCAGVAVGVAVQPGCIGPRSRDAERLLGGVIRCSYARVQLDMANEVAPRERLQATLRDPAGHRVDQ
jgi:hypothetical protein